LFKNILYNKKNAVITYTILKYPQNSIEFHVLVCNRKKSGIYISSVWN